MYKKISGFKIIETKKEFFWKRFHQKMLDISEIFVYNNVRILWAIFLALNPKN